MGWGSYLLLFGVIGRLFDFGFKLFLEGFVLVFMIIGRGVDYYFGEIGFVGGMYCWFNGGLVGRL